jgi:hypothetical protein
VGLKSASTFTATSLVGHPPTSAFWRRRQGRDNLMYALPDPGGPAVKHPQRHLKQGSAPACSALTLRLVPCIVSASYESPCKAGR